MAKEVRWTLEAVDRFQDVIDYLETEWTEREIINFIAATNNIIRLISERPRMFRKTNKRDVHEALVTPHNLLIYQVYSKHIDILTFWDTRKNPKKKKF
jgi:plasmid stabilization system protein ParE